MSCYKIISYSSTFQEIVCKIVKVLMMRNPLSHGTILQNSVVLRSNFPLLNSQGAEAIKNSSIIYWTNKKERHTLRIKEVRYCILLFLPNSEWKTVDEKIHFCQIQYRFKKPKSYVLVSLRHFCSRRDMSGVTLRESIIHYLLIEHLSINLIKLHVNSNVR